MSTDITTTVVQAPTLAFDIAALLAAACVAAACCLLVASFVRLRRERHALALEKETVRMKCVDDATLLARKSNALERALADIAELREALDKSHQETEKARESQKTSLVSVLTLEDTLKKQEARVADLTASLSKKAQEAKESMEAAKLAETNLQQLKVVVQTMGDERKQVKQSDERTKQRLAELTATIAKLTENAKRDEARIEGLSEALSAANDKLVACLGTLGPATLKQTPVVHSAVEEPDLPIAYEFSSPPDDDPTASFTSEAPTVALPMAKVESVVAMPMKAIPIRNG